MDKSSGHDSTSDVWGRGESAGGFWLNEWTPKLNFFVKTFQFLGKKMFWTNGPLAEYDVTLMDQLESLNIKFFFTKLLHE